MKKIFVLILISFLTVSNLFGSTNNDTLYKKIDLFAEVLDKIKKEYVDKVDQSQLIDDAINGALQSLDQYSAYMNPEFLTACKLIRGVNLVVWELRLVWRRALSK